MYNQIDIGLDPFPYNGITTTCDALWMGVPVLTITGNLPAGRAGLSLLTVVGLPELVAQSEDEYVRTAQRISTDVSGLSQIRASLRSRMQSSPMTDARRFARNMEDAYRSAWRKWCARSV
jgi:predicted O-linked N-acetylglucosamine transferase (SPINDLY family)